MTLPSRFIHSEKERHFLYDHFKNQLKQMPCAASAPEAEQELRRLCEHETLNPKQMQTLWELWLTLARIDKGPLTSIAKAYEAVLEETAESTPSEWSCGDLAILQENFLKKFDAKHQEILTAQQIRPQVQAAGAVPWWDLLATISSGLNRSNPSQLDQSVIGLLHEKQPVTQYLKQEAQKSSQKTKTKTNDDTGVVGAGLNRRQPSPLSDSGHGASSQLSPSSSAASHAPPNVQGLSGQPSVNNMPPIKLPPSALSSRLGPSNSTATIQIKDRLAQDWQHYVMQDGHTDQGFAIQESGVQKCGAARLKISTHNDSAVEVLHQACAATVKVTIAGQVPYSQAMIIAANMATVAYFNKLSVEEVAQLNVELLVIDTKNPGFEQAIKQAMTAYINGMKCQASALQATAPNGASPDSVPSRVDHDLPLRPSLNPPANVSPTSGARGV